MTWTANRGPRRGRGVPARTKGAARGRTWGASTEGPSRPQGARRRRVTAGWGGGGMWRTGRGHGRRGDRERGRVTAHGVKGVTEGVPMGRRR